MVVYLVHHLSVFSILTIDLINYFIHSSTAIAYPYLFYLCFVNDKFTKQIEINACLQLQDPYSRMMVADPSAAAAAAAMGVHPAAAAAAHHAHAMHHHQVLKL